MVYLGLLLIFTAVSYCFNPLKLRKLDISQRSLNSCTEYNEHHLDNVYYSYFKPLPDVLINSVYEGHYKIWESKLHGEFCKYALVAYKHQSPYLIYILRDNPEFTCDAYYVKYELGWEPIDGTTYKELINQLEKIRHPHNVTLFLDNNSTLPTYATVHEYVGKFRVQFVAPKYGYTAWRVHLNGTIWSSRGNESRCAAVWCYLLDGFNITYVRLLVKHSDGEAELLDFYQKNRRWERPLDTTRFATILGIESPDSFLHPEYEFMDRIGEIHFPPFRPQTDQWDLVSSNTDPNVLYIDTFITNEYVFTQKIHLDGVFYQVFRPKGDAMVYSVKESYLKVWRPYRDEVLKLAIVAYDRNIPVLMYTVINFGNTINTFYFRKKVLRTNTASNTTTDTASGNNFRDEDYINNSCWIRTTCTYYKEKIDKLSLLSYEKVENVTLDIYLPSDSNLFYYTTGKGYSYYSPKPTYKITRVMNQLDVIWESTDGERVISAYVYENGTPYLIKLVVADSSSTRVIVYYLLNDKFAMVKSVLPQPSMQTTLSLNNLVNNFKGTINDSYKPIKESNDKSIDKETNETNKESNDVVKYKLILNGQLKEVMKEHYDQVVKGLEEFYYPQYDFTPKIPEFPLSYPLDTYQSLYNFSYYQSLNSNDVKALTNTIRNGVTNTSVVNNSVTANRGVNVGVPGTSVNVNRDVKEFIDNFVVPYYNMEDCILLDISHPNKKLTQVSDEVFDGVIKVKFIQPLPGKYFKEISEKETKMYMRLSNSEASIGIHLYSNQNRYVLADVMLAASRPASIHLKKVNDMWKYIRKSEFTQLMQQLKSNN
uniref:SfiI-subtelomeric related protein family member n=1 Tax=Theileria annulata TaxID=5874 RepID=A0A3B0NIY0_THEAN